LEGQIGEYATLVRKSGNDWFLGSLTGSYSRNISIDLSFLDNGADYAATVYTHDPESKSSTKVKIEEMTLSSDHDLQFEIESNSGLAIHFRRI
jgi:alpha-glucosidase